MKKERKKEHILTNYFSDTDKDGVLDDFSISTHSKGSLKYQWEYNKKIKELTLMTDSSHTTYCANIHGQIIGGAGPSTYLNDSLFYRGY